MKILARPVWPVLTLAAVQLVDAALCLRPAPFVGRCLDDVHCPPGLRRLLPPIKAAAALGLLSGLVVPPLGTVTCAALVTYFAIAVTLHLRFDNLGLNAANATGLALACGAVTRCFAGPRG